MIRNIFKAAKTSGVLLLLLLSLPGLSLADTTVLRVSAKGPLDNTSDCIEDILNDDASGIPATGCGNFQYWTAGLSKMLSFVSFDASALPPYGATINSVVLEAKWYKRSLYNGNKCVEWSTDDGSNFTNSSLCPNSFGAETWLVNSQDITSLRTWSAAYLANMDIRFTNNSISSLSTRGIAWDYIWLRVDFTPPPDSDGDGMPDSWENLHGCLMANTVDGAIDSDSDGMTNLAEYLYSILIDPCDPDTDNDGLLDGAEITNLTDPFDSDSDNDGLEDGPEVNLYLTNPRSPDTDNDLMPDGWEVNAFCVWVNPLVGDSLQDGDTDALSNRGEYLAGANPCDSDSDNDGLDDGPEVNLYLTNPLDNDTDHDTLTDGAEVNIWLTNPLNPDSDGDGFNDSDEVNVFDTDPLVFDLDADADGLPNAVETNTGILISLQNTGTNPNLADMDADGMNDLREIVAGSNPFDERVTPRGKIGADLRVTSATDASYEPFIFWTGNEYAVSWADGRDGAWKIYFTRISAAGVKLGADVIVASSAYGPRNPSLLWTGSEFGVSWQDSYEEIYFTRISATGAKLGSDLRVTNAANSSFDSSLAWTGSEYGVSWVDLRDGGIYEIYFARISAAGVKLGEDVRLTRDGAYSLLPSLVWTGSEFGVSWYDNRDGHNEVYFARVSAAGVKLSEDLRISSLDPYASYYESLSWTGSEFGISWTEARGGKGEIYFARVSPMGVKLGSDVQVTRISASSGSPWLSWTGSEFGVSWQHNGDGGSGNYENYFATISAAGVKLGSDLRVTYDAAASNDISISWSGSEFGMIWRDLRDGNDEIYFARIQPDRDGDGLADINEGPAGTNAGDWDSDDDFIPDGYEVNRGSLCGMDPLANDAAADNDNDQVDNLTEYGFGSNPCQADSDADGIDDYLEIYVYGTDPVAPDTDLDGMWDGWELDHSLNFLADDADADPDGDSFTNLQEFTYSLDPHHFDIFPASSCSSSTFNTASAEVPIHFLSANPEADTRLYVNYNYSGEYLPTALHNTGAAGTFVYTFDRGPGLYRFYTLSTIGILPEVAPDWFTPDHAIMYYIPPPISFITSAPTWSSNSVFPLDFITNSPDGETRLWVRKNGGGWQDSGLASVAGEGGTFMFVPDGAGFYDFYTIVSSLVGGTEPPPSFPDHDATVIIDASAPVTTGLAVTDDGNYAQSSSMLHAVWTAASDPESGILQYEYAIGTAPGLTDVAGWTSVGLNLEMARFALSLIGGQTYFIGVHAINGAGMPSSPSWSDGIMVDVTPPAILSSSPAHREVANDFVALPVNLPVTLRISDLQGSGIDWSSLAVVLDFTAIAPGAIVRDGSTVTFTSPALNLGNHVINVSVHDRAGNGLFQNIIFVVEDPAKVIINPVAAEWRPGDAPLTFVADGGTGIYHWTATGGTLSAATGSTVTFTPSGAAGAFAVSVSDDKLVSAMADVTVRGPVELAPAVVRLNPGDTVSFDSSGGAGNFNWTVSGGSCALTGFRSERCLFTASGIDGEYSVTAAAGTDSFSSRVIVVGSVGRAIIVVGGGLVDENRQVAELSAMGKLAYETLLRRGFSRGQILYLDPDPLQAYDGDGDGYANDIDGAPSPAALQAALTTWAVADRGVNDPPIGLTVPLILYFVDHGAPGSFLINYTSAGAQQLVTASDLDGWLDAAQATGAKAVLIYDACYSGTFLPVIGAGGANRIVASSSASDKSAYFSVGGTVSFSQFFWAQVRQNLSVGAAFAQARLALSSWSGQDPWLDDNGDGLYLTAGNKDGTAAGNLKIGAPFVAGGVAPALAPCGDVALSAGSSAELCTYLNNVSADEVATVFAIITPPGYSAPQSAGDFKTPSLNGKDGHPLPRVHLTWDAGAGRWSHVFDPGQIARVFTVNGRYTATLFARDKRGAVSARAEVILTIFGPDAYEEDDVFGAASAIEINDPAAQAHNFDAAYDDDWVRVEVAAGGTYKFYTEKLGERADTLLSLYGPGAPGPLVAMDDDSGAESRSSMIVVYLSPGTYYLLASQYDGSVWGEGTDYDLRAESETLGAGVGSMEGYITDSVSGFGIYGASVKVTVGDVSTTVTTGTGGYYLFNSLVPGSYTVLARRSNYTDYTATGVTIVNGQRSTRNVILAAKTGTGVLSGTVSSGGSPLGGVSLSVSGIPLPTNVNGAYAVRLLAGSAHTLSATAAGYQTYTASGIVVTAGLTTTRNVTMTPVVTDTDGDGLVDTLEATGCTSPAAADTDGDGLNDGAEDANHNGVVDPTETNPCDSDTDNDGLDDGLEYTTLLSDPLYWDTDGDGLPDSYEYDHRVGFSPSLNLISAADGALDPDLDGNPIAHEYWNGSDPWAPGPVGAAGCYFWGDANGDGYIGPPDNSALTALLKGAAPSYSAVIPDTAETQDLNADTYFGPPDLALLAQFLKGSGIPSMPSRPTGIELVSSGPANVKVGDTTHLRVGMRNTAGLFTPGFGVVFSIDPTSTGAATIFGGEGGAAGDRYDVGGTTTLSPPSRIVVRVDSAGTIKINASTPQCGEVLNMGRYCNALNMPAPFIITGHE